MIYSLFDLLEFDLLGLFTRKLTRHARALTSHATPVWLEQMHVVLLLLRYAHHENRESCGWSVPHAPRLRLVTSVRVHE